MSNIHVSDVTVLILDDSAFARSIMKRILSSAGFNNIAEASSGAHALEFLSEVSNNIDIIFCDLMMPDMDGIEFLRHVEVLRVKPAFMFVSGVEYGLLDTVETAARARDLHVLGSVQKPFTLDAAHRALRKFNEINATVLKSAAGRAQLAPITREELQTALDQDQFQLHYQPKVSVADGGLLGFESLARWKHPERGFIPPDIFIFAAEKLGMINEVTERTISLALHQCAQWNDADLHKKMSLNLSAYMLVDTEFPQRLLQETLRHGVSPEQIMLEVTETGIFKNLADSLEILARLKMKGYQLSIDDFGTGYSSLQQLSRVPFTEMKIDRSFVHGVNKSTKAEAILNSSVELGKKLGMTVVAEGAETKEDMDVLRALGVDTVQGYYIARPMQADRVLAWSEDWARDPHV